MSTKQIQLFKLMDALSEQVNNVIHDAVISRKRNRLNVIDQGAKEAERLTKEIQILVNSMRRQKVDAECQK
ncbi:hypothetical protein HRF59_04885 [Bacillus velezensis]|uniref:hypothetical protein n=1 Tax=Bacillus amyloliquefaciens group TaxID=1938374 RepID=UPI00039AD4F6|nr:MULTISPECIES: hypothetical protein [Bacillus amyloliquefaciens group]AUS16078.1 hypothetical protein C0W57_07765 [Bacillus velezensis]AVB11482.1 hypothetical protein C3438_19320 [Bacillus velezensis]MEC0383012.1 hypothetical protein [Bacillus velezensis]MEC0403169.1 hypothetical protein [Bacillus velezensis]NHN20952.1 hypothetical protein [Bacillus amyloliquefaciens]